MNTVQSAAKAGPVRLSSRRSMATPVRAATLRPRAVRGSRLVVRAEKVVGIDLGTTNSAVSARGWVAADASWAWHSSPE